MLPLSKEVKRVAVIGPNADNVYNQLGDYTAPQAPGSVITVLEGIRQKLPGAEVCYVKGCAVRDTLDTSIGEACETAKSDVAGWFWGRKKRDFETDFLETGAAVANERKVSDMESGEGFDRIGLSLMGKQVELLNVICHGCFRRAGHDSGASLGVELGCGTYPGDLNDLVSGR